MEYITNEIKTEDGNIYIIKTPKQTYFPPLDSLPHSALGPPEYFINGRQVKSFDVVDGALVVVELDDMPDIDQRFADQINNL